MSVIKGTTQRGNPEITVGWLCGSSARASCWRYANVLQMQAQNHCAVC